MWKPILISLTLAAPLTLPLATSLAAQEWRDRTGDELFTNDELHRFLSGRSLVFYDGGTSKYDENGNYLWTYAEGGDWYGYWRVTDGSIVCVDYVTEVTRCDRIVRNDGKLVVLTADGQRFPVRHFGGTDL